MQVKSKKFSLCLATLLLVSFSFQAFPNDCGPGKKALHYLCDVSVINNIGSGFSADFMEQLKNPLKEIGYCLTVFSPDVLTDSSKINDLVMNVSLFYPDSDSVAVLLIGLQSIELFQQKEVFENPLISLVYEPGEISTFKSVLVKKTIENLRTEYVCHLRIQSAPEGVRIRGESGLEGSTPLEWILPVGNMEITGELDGYEPVHRRLDLSKPGIHTYLLEMRKRQFYTSKFIYPAAIFGLGAVTCFAAERYYYSKYMELGREDFFNHPERFENTFNRAKTFERAALTSLILSAVSFTLTFWF
ncbi:MAG: PEGA domain-containing protein [Fibrobacter sp.]|jgi:hypothetical protein|nr:PEGA domain-containing protein [Fibrobacter sp.]